MNLAFKYFDKDGNGAISIEELKQTLANEEELSTSEDEINKMIAEVDKNGDGMVIYYSQQFN